MTMDLSENPPSKDIEKRLDHHAEAAASFSEIPASEPIRFQGWLARIGNLQSIETRGIERVPVSLRYQKVTSGSYLEMFLIWFSINCTANNMTVGILGPISFRLGFQDAIICCFLGTLFGSACTGYVSSFGPKSGLRTLVVARFSMGYWPSKLCALLNIVIEVGYGLVDCLVAGLILSAVNGHNMTVIVGIIISSIITWVVATFGIKWFNMLERYIWLPTVLILFILIGCAGPKFDPESVSRGKGSVVAGNRLSYFFLAASGALGWAPASADFYSYYPESTSRVMTGAMTALGILMGKMLIEILGIGLASGIAQVPSWAAAFDKSTGALIAEAFAPLGHFGKFCAVVLALCVSANNIPGTYAAGLNFQILGRWFAKAPRPIWSTIVVIIFTVCAIAGRAQLLTIFLNFLSLIGYWVIIWITITMEDEFIFRRSRGYDWDSWADKSHLPLGHAALASFLIGWVGAILCMYQTYFTGPIARLVGNGADLGLPVAMSWTSLVYPVLRYFELKQTAK